MFFKEFLPLIRRNDLCNMKEYLVIEINVNNLKYFLSYLYRSPSKCHEELESFCSNLGSLLSNINDQHLALSFATGDVNEKYW